MNTNSNKIVFIDVDGTLLKGFITLDFVNYLFKKNLFDSTAYQKQLDLMGLFKKKQIGLFEWLSEWALIWGLGIKGRQEGELVREAKKFFENYNNFYASSKQLINFFHSRGYKVIGVTVGVSEVGELVKNYLELDEIFSSKVEIKKGVYTGRVATNLHKESGKIKIVVDYAKKNRINLVDCVGVGDSIHDSTFIDLVGKKIALNPDNELLSYAKLNKYLVSTHSNILDDVKKLGL